MVQYYQVIRALSFASEKSRLLKSTIRFASSNSGLSQKRVLVPIATGTEEIEAVSIIDTLVRGGASVTVASVESDLTVICSRGVKLTADSYISNCVEEYDIIVCPGGMPGAERLRDSMVLRDLLVKQNRHGKLIGAICASPAVILVHHNLIPDVSVTCYPANKFTSIIPKHNSKDNVVVDKNFITSQGPGTSLAFSLKIVEILFGVEKSNQLAKEMIFS
eukprot:gene9852-13252_t